MGSLEKNVQIFSEAQENLKIPLRCLIMDLIRMKKFQNFSLIHTRPKFW